MLRTSWMVLGLLILGFPGTGCDSDSGSGASCEQACEAVRPCSGLWTSTTPCAEACALHEVSQLTSGCRASWNARNNCLVTLTGCQDKAQCAAEIAAYEDCEDAADAAARSAARADEDARQAARRAAREDLPPANFDTTTTYGACRHYAESLDACSAALAATMGSTPTTTSISFCDEYEADDQSTTDWMNCMANAYATADCSTSTGFSQATANKQACPAP